MFVFYFSVVKTLAKSSQANYYFLLFGREDLGEILTSVWQEGGKLWSPETLLYRNISNYHHHHHHHRRGHLDITILRGPAPKKGLMISGSKIESADFYLTSRGYRILFKGTLSRCSARANLFLSSENNGTVTLSRHAASCHVMPRYICPIRLSRSSLNYRKKGQLAQVVRESDLFFRVKRQRKTVLTNVVVEHVKSRMSNAKTRQR